MHVDLRAIRFPHAHFASMRCFCGLHAGYNPLKYRSWRRSFLTHATAAANWARGQAMHAFTWPAVHDRWVAAMDVSPDYLLTGSVSSEVKVSQLIKSSANITSLMRQGTC